MKIEIKSGDKFNMLTIIKELDKKRLPCGQVNRIILCKCDCGNLTEVRLLHLVRYRIKSCGCIVGTKSGDSTGGKLYNTWRAMKNRCNHNYFQKNYYSVKNITLYHDWNNYGKFKSWALENGWVEGLVIDRIDNSLGYYPENCHFVTAIENVNNRDNTFFVVYKGRRVSFSLLLMELGKHNNYSCIYRRLKRGWDTETAIETKPRIGNYKRK
jgi:hypothetical protein